MSVHDPTADSEDSEREGGLDHVDDRYGAYKRNDGDLVIMDHESRSDEEAWIRGRVEVGRRD